MAVQMLGIKTKFTDDQGRPLVGGKVHAYFAGTTTNQDTFKDPDMTIVNTNPIILDDSGSADVYLNGSYRIRIFDKNDVLIEEQDGVTQSASGEITTAKGEIIGLYGAVLNSLTNEVKRAVAAEKTIADSLASETTRAKSAELALQSSIDAEAVRAKAAESDLNDDIIKEVSDRESEVARLDEADAVLQAQINSVGGGKLAYKTYAEMVADKANIAAKSSIDIIADTDDKNGTYLYDGADFVKSQYDLEKIIRAKVQNTFGTYTQMVASNLSDGAYALVADDDNSKNGIYIKEGGQWVKSDLLSITTDPRYRYISTDSRKRAGIASGVSTDLVYKETGLNANQNIIPVRLSDKDDILRVVSGDNSGYVLFAEGAESLHDGYGFNENDPNFIRFNANTTEDIKIPVGSSYAIVSGRIAPGLDRAPTMLAAGSDFPISSSDIPDRLRYSLAAPRKLSPRMSEGYFELSDTVFSHTQVPADLSYYDSSSIELQGGLMLNKEDSVYGTLMPTIDLRMDEGSVLEFLYQPFGGTVLYEVDIEGNKSYPLFTDLGKSSTIKSETYVSDSKKTVRLYTNVAYYQKVDGALYGNNVNAHIFFKLRPILSSYATPAASDRYSSNLSVPIKMKQGQTLNVTQMAGEVGVVEVLDNGALLVLDSSSSAYSKKGSELFYTANRDCTIRVCYNKLAYVYLYDGTSNVVPEPIESTIHRRLKSLGQSSSSADFSYIPNAIEAKYYYSDVFAAHGTYILRMVDIEGVEHISISIDNGKNWSNIENTLGDISHVHFFTDGTILLGSNTKLYWTDDYETLNESTVYDHDGSLFDPSKTTERHFFTTPNIDKPMVTPDGEIHAWGEYVLTGIPRFWYTTDRGRTVKCAVKFGTTVMDGRSRVIRHVHRVVYHQKANCFYMTTGDHGGNGTHNMLFRMTYNWSSDEWEWEFLNSGWLYKFTTIFFDDTYAYVLTDFTSIPEREKNGFYRVLPEFLGDFSKYRAICYNDIPSGALTKLFVDGAGNKILTPDGGGTTWGHVWIARGDYRFKRVNFSDGKHVGQCLGVTDNGDVYFKVFAASPSGDRDSPNGHKQNGISINMTEALRDNGITNFMFGSDNLGIINGSSRHTAY